MSEFTLEINNETYRVEADAYEPLRDVIRSETGLTGTKSSCDSGVCGVCTVLLDGDATKSCLVPVCKAEEKSITTIEGLGEGDGLSDVQQAFVDTFASQCGYCIPGFVMSATAMLEENPDPTTEEIRKGLSGNICRCTGYVKIIDAVKQVANKGDTR